jgi:hypothetical protein
MQRLDPGQVTRICHSIWTKSLQICFVTSAVLNSWIGRTGRVSTALVRSGRALGGKSLRVQIGKV